jgi:hypothetical protein
MKYSANSRKNAARTERLQQRVDAGFVVARFPKVASIVISMIYNQVGLNKALLRTVNFFPDSSAFFRVDCVNRDCVNGGFDLTQVITDTVGKHKETAKGKLSCEGNGPIAGHSSIAYQIKIIYV